jgi:hypothetical protein
MDDPHALASMAGAISSLVGLVGTIHTFGVGFVRTNLLLLLPGSSFFFSILGVNLFCHEPS